MIIEDPMLCLEHCLYPDEDGCPDWCERHGRERAPRPVAKNAPPSRAEVRERGMELLRKGKPAYLVAAIVGVTRQTVHNWALSIAREE